MSASQQRDASEPRAHTHVCHQLTGVPGDRPRHEHPRAREQAPWLGCVSVSVAAAIDDQRWPVSVMPAPPASRRGEPLDRRTRTPASATAVTVVGNARDRRLARSWISSAQLRVVALELLTTRTRSRQALLEPRDHAAQPPDLARKPRVVGPQHREQALACLSSGCRRWRRPHRPREPWSGVRIGGPRMMLSIRDEDDVGMRACVLPVAEVPGPPRPAPDPGPPLPDPGPDPAPPTPRPDPGPLPPDPYPRPI